MYERSTAYAKGKAKPTRKVRLLALLICLIFSIQSVAAVWASSGGVIPEEDAGMQLELEEDGSSEEGTSVEEVSDNPEEIIADTEENLNPSGEEVPGEEQEDAGEFEVPQEEAPVDTSEEPVLEVEEKEGTAVEEDGIVLENDQVEAEEENVGATYYRDTVLVLDRSGSMGGTPLKEVKKAALEFCSGILEGGDSRVAIVQFGSDVQTACSFTNNKKTLETAINALSSSGGTNTTEAMKAAYKLLKTSKATVKNLVLMTDGATESGETSSKGHYTSGPYYTYANALYNAVIPMHKDCNVYTLGFFHSVSSSNRQFFAQVLEDIQNAGYYEIEDAGDLGFIFGEVAEDISGEYKEMEEAFIKEHLDFLKSKEYTNLKNWNAGEDFLNQYGDLFANYLTWQVITKQVSDNPYDIVLGDLVLSQGAKDAQEKTMELHVKNNLWQITNSFIDLIDETGEISKDGRNAIQKLIQTDDMSDKTTFQSLQKLLDKVSEDTLNKFFNLYADAKIVAQLGGQALNTVNAVINLIHYSAVVDAFSKTSDEFKMVLIVAAYESGEPLLSSAVEEYCSIMTTEDAEKKLAEKIASVGVGQALSWGKTLFGEATVNGVKNFFISNMDLSNAGALAGKVNSFIAGCKIGYEAGKIFCNIFFNSDETAATYIMAYATAKTADAITGTIGNCESNLLRNKSITAAKLFCESFSMSAKAQMLAVDRIIGYLEAMRDASIDKRAYVVYIYQWLLYKVEWQGVSCHNPNTVPDLYRDPNKTYIQIACPTDVEVTDTKGNVVFRTVNGEVTYAKSGIASSAAYQVKHVVLPGGDDYKVNIKATGDGSMRYAVCEFEKNDKMTEGIVYNDVPLRTGATFQSTVSPGNQAKETPKLESQGEEVVCETEKIDGDFIQSITLNTKSKTINRGKTTTLKAAITPAFLQNEKLTWKSSKPSIATVTSKGVVKGVKKGKTTITASSSNGVKATCTITVKEIPSKKVKLSKKTVTVNTGLTVTLKAVLSPKNTTDTMKWTSSNKKIATVTSKGVIKGIRPGSVTVTGTTTSGKKATCKVYVKEVKSSTVKLKKTSLTLEQGKTYSLLSSAAPKGSSGTVKWTSSNKKIATVTSAGIVEGIKDGSAVITATASSGKKVKCKVRVKDYRIKKVTMKPTSVSLKVGASKKLTATLTPTYAKEKLTWTSSNGKVVSVTKTGTIKALRGGQATITASSPSGKKATCKVEAIQPVEKIEMRGTLELTEGMQYRLSPNVLPANATDPTLRFTTDNYKVAIVSARGLIKAKTPGTAKITAISSEGVQAVCTVTVNKEIIVPKEVKLDQESAVLNVGEKLKLTATIEPENAEDKTLVWESSDPAVAEVKDGTVTGKKIGAAAITVTTVNGKKAVCQITVKGVLIQTDKNEYSCKKGDILEVKVDITLPEDIVVNQKKYVMETSYNIGGDKLSALADYNVDGSAWFEERPNSGKTVTIDKESIQVYGNKAQVILKYDTTNVEESSRKYLISIFPYYENLNGTIKSLYAHSFTVKFE